VTDAGGPAAAIGDRGCGYDRVMAVGEERTLRTDAARNRGRIVAAATEVFAERGLDASVTEVAERAGVGSATVFRRFPTKQDLVDAVIADQLDAVLADAAAAAADPDPRRGLEAFCERTCKAQAHDQGFKEAVSARMLDHEPLRRRAGEVMEHLRTIVDRAKAAGLVREDVAAEDLPVLLHAVASAGTFDPGQEGLHRRYLAIMLAGLRPPGDHAPLPCPPPPPGSLERGLARAPRPAAPPET
jgi:AcrR family transcriptional regulator